MKSLVLVIFILLLSLPAYAQTAKAEVIDEFGELPCGHLMSKADLFFMLYSKRPGSKMYVVYYEGPYSGLVRDKTTRKSKWTDINPVRGYARNYAESVSLILKNTHKFAPGDFIAVDGGYDLAVRLQFWIVPPGAEFPKPKSPVEAKDIRFRPGKPGKPLDCTKMYL